MILGTVLGKLSLQRSVSGGEAASFVQVRCGGQLLTALDPVGVRAGETVLLILGESAARLCPEIPVDAAVIGVAGNNG